MFVNAPDLRNSDGTTYNSQDDKRVTRIGKFLREYSIDELPQIINIVFSEMSFIGPRPELPESYETHTDNEFVRLKVRPGITGWAAINGRNQLEIKARRVLDVYYVENLSFQLDFEIFFKTILLLLKKENVYSK
jgi:lipopolysaccharide/colanic/teichoic acid biosynthesis glycosyltransferase